MFKVRRRFCIAGCLGDRVTRSIFLLRTLKLSRTFLIDFGNFSHPSTIPLNKVHFFRNNYLFDCSWCNYDCSFRPDDLVHVVSDYIFVVGVFCELIWVLSEIKDILFNLKPFLRIILDHWS